MQLALVAVFLLAQAGGFTRLPRTSLSRKLTPFPAALSLAVKTSAGEVRASSANGAPGVTGPAGDPSPAHRPTAVLKAGEKPEIRWYVRSTDRQKPIKDVAVHFLVQREEAAGEAVPAAPRKGSLMDQVLGTDLAPGSANSGNYHTAIYEPGVYLVELELLDPDGNRRQYCVMELRVEPK